MANQKLIKAIVITILGIIAAVAVFSFLNFLPRYVQESVKIITVDQSGCTVETSDKFIIKISPCDGRPGQTIVATYDEKMKERFRATEPP